MQLFRTYGSRPKASGIGSSHVSSTRQMKILFRWIFCANGGRVSCPRQVLLDLTACSSASCSAPACPTFQCFGLKKSVICRQTKPASFCWNPGSNQGPLDLQANTLPTDVKVKGLYTLDCISVCVHQCSHMGEGAYIKLIPRAQQVN